MAYLRQQMGLVSQEPILFDYSIEGQHRSHHSRGVLSSDLIFSTPGVRLYYLKFLRIHFAYNEINSIHRCMLPPHSLTWLIPENIKYGALHRKVTEDEVRRAAIAANINNFILTLPDVRQLFLVIF